MLWTTPSNLSLSANMPSIKIVFFEDIIQNRFRECGLLDNSYVHRSHLDCAHNVHPYHYLSSERSHT